MDKTYEELLDDVRSGKARILMVGPGSFGFDPEELRRVVESLKSVQQPTPEMIVILDDSRRPQSPELPVLEAALSELLMESYQRPSEEELAEEVEKRCNHWWKQPARWKGRRRFRG